MEDGYDNKDVSTGHSSFVDCVDVALDLVFNGFGDLQKLGSDDWNMVAETSNWIKLEDDVLMARHGFNPSVQSLKNYVETFSQRYCEGKQGCIEKLKLWVEKSGVKSTTHIDSKDQIILSDDTAEMEQCADTPRSPAGKSPALDLIHTPKPLDDEKNSVPKCGPKSFKKRASADSLSVNTTLSSSISPQEAVIDRYRKRLKVSSPINIHGNMFQSPVPVPNSAVLPRKRSEEESENKFYSGGLETHEHDLEKFDGGNADSIMQLQLQLKYDQVRCKLRQVDAERNDLLRLHSIEMTSKEYERQKSEALVQDMTKKKNNVEQRAKQLESQLEESVMLINNSKVKHAEELEQYQRKVALYKIRGWNLCSKICCCDDTHFLLP